MIIGISALGPLSQDTGGRTYLTNLIKTLQKMPGENKYILFMSKGESHFLSIYSANIRVVEIGFSISTFLRIFSEHFVLPFFIIKYRIHAMYFPGNYASLYCPVPYVLAVRSMLVYNHDVGESVNLIRHWYRKFVIPRSARRAEYIVTPSEHTKYEILEFLNIPSSKINVIPHGIDAELFGSPKNEEEADRIFAQYKVHRPFFLYVSALWEYKNQDKLIKAFHKLIAEKNIPHNLVLIGRGMSAYESYAFKLKQLVEELTLVERVVFIDFLPHSTLKHFYQHTDVFVFPSLIESFGNSLFEAMAAGAPVVCSNTHGFPGLVKNAALLTNPRNIDELADAIYKVWTDSGVRHQLLSNGKLLSDSLTWDSCFTKTFSLFDNIH